MARLLLISVLMNLLALAAQTTPTVTYNSIQTPEISLNSIKTPYTSLRSIGTPDSNIDAAAYTGTAPPSAEALSQPSSQSAVAELLSEPISRTALLALRNFDFVISPIHEFAPGSMEDLSISLGEYARQIRAQRKNENSQTAPLKMTPNIMSQPTNPK